MNSKQCKYCGRVFNSVPSLRAHYRYCSEKLKLTEGFEEKIQKNMDQLKMMSKSGCLKISEIAKERKLADEQFYKDNPYVCANCGKVVYYKYGSGKYCSRGCANSRKHSDETKRKIAEAAKNFGTTSNFFKKGYYKGIWCDSSWELAFLVCCEEDGIRVIRNTDSFEYINPVDSSTHLYYPDFYLPNEDTYVEIKGVTPYYNDAIVLAKRNSLNSLKLLHIQGEDALQMVGRAKKIAHITNLEDLYDNAPIRISKKHSPRTSGKVWMYNPVSGVQTLVDKEMVADNLSVGWIVGRPKRTKK